MEIHRHIVEVYGEGAMNEGNVRKGCRLFKEGRTTRGHTSLPVHADYSEQFKWEILEHLPYSSDFAPSVSPPQEVFGRPDSERQKTLGRTR
jgi:hypothetical protein